MAPEDLALAVERHATSKLKEDEDLFRICDAWVSRRGAAEHRIGVPDGDPLAYADRGERSSSYVSIGGKREADGADSGASAGTTIEISDIFFNTPARRKFLKSPATELSHICDVVNRIALAHPSVHFRLQHDGRTRGGLRCGQ